MINRIVTVSNCWPVIGGLTRFCERLLVTVLHPQGGGYSKNSWRIGGGEINGFVDFSGLLNSFANYFCVCDYCSA